MAFPVPPPYLNVIREHPKKIISQDQSNNELSIRRLGTMTLCIVVMVFPSLFIKYVTIPRGHQLLKMQYVNKIIFE